jgi:transposase
MGMSLSTADLPQDPNDLRRVAGDLQRDVAALSAEIYAKTLLIEKLKMQLAVLRRARFGRSSERLEGDIEETEAENEVRAETAEQSEATAPSSSKRRRQPSGRAPLPDHLPQEVITHEPDCVCPACGGEKFSKIGADEREVLEYVPSYFKRVLHVRPQMSCRTCETIVQAPMPSLPIEKGRASGSCARVEVLRSPASAPPSGYLHPQRGRHRSLDNGGLGRPYGSIA